jgi:hypothetical protein
MELDDKIEHEISPQNEFTGSMRESNEPPAHDEPICLVSYEITAILLGDGPSTRSGFWKNYRRELALNKKTDYNNYHVTLCRHLLTSLRMRLDQPVYFRNKRLTTERELSPVNHKALSAFFN